MDVEDQHKGFDGRCWQVHKFGGTSVADASCFLKVAAIVEEQIGIVHSEVIGVDNDLGDIQELKASPSTAMPECNLAVVVSAMGGKPKVTDLLLQSVSAAAERNEEKVNNCLQFIQDKHDKCLNTLFNESEVDSESCSKVVESLKAIISKDLNDIKDILKTVSLMKWQAKRISELVSGYGETWSSQILSALLSKRARERDEKNDNDNHGEEEANIGQDFVQPFAATTGEPTHHYFRYIDARRIITIDEEAIKDGAVCWDISMDKMKKVYEEESIATFGSGTKTSNSKMHFVITGYVASNTQSVATTLQRDGSDYSAAIMGRLLEAALIAIWTDVDGVLSADPRRVPHSYVLPEVSFNEAMELGKFDRDEMN